MLIRRTLLPLWCAAFVVAAVYSFTVQTLEPSGRVAGNEQVLAVAGPLQGDSCLAADGGRVLDASLDSGDPERLLCVDTLDCGGCCGPRGQLKKFWDCCRSGGGLDCAAICIRHRP